MNDKIFGDGSDGEVTLPSCEDLTKNTWYAVAGPSKDKTCVVCKSPVEEGFDCITSAVYLCSNCLNDPSIGIITNGYRVMATCRVEEEK